MSIDTLKLHTCMFSIDKGSVKNDEILKCAHSRHCGYCSSLCLAVVEKCRKIMFYVEENKHRINLIYREINKITPRHTKQYTNFT